MFRSRHTQNGSIIASCNWRGFKHLIMMLLLFLVQLIAGPQLLVFTFPVLFVALLGCVYLHLGKKSPDYGFKRQVNIFLITHSFHSKTRGLLTHLVSTIFCSCLLRACLFHLLKLVVSSGLSITVSIYQRLIAITDSK